MTNEKPVRSKWRITEHRRLRLCVCCGIEFASTGSANRYCIVCLKREAEARARPFSMDSDRRELLKEFLSDFDDDTLDRRHREKKHDDKLRESRQKKILNNKAPINPVVVVKENNNLDVDYSSKE